MDRRYLLALLLASCQASSKASPGRQDAQPEEPEPPVMADASRAAPDVAARDAALVPPADAAAPSPDVAPPSADGPAPVAGWWDPKWTRRRAITITHPGKEALVDFVVPLQMPTNAVGADLRFVAGGTVLNHELERYGPGAVAWVRVPRIAAGVSGVAFTAYYGNPAATEQPGEVWAAPHAGVWHFAGDAKDATANHYDGAKVQVRFQSGMFGSGAAFDYARQEHISLVNNSKLVSGAGAVTVSAWVMHSGVVHDGQDIILGIGTASTSGHLSRVSVAISPDLGLIGEANPDEGAWDVVDAPAGSLPNAQMHHLAVIIDAPAKTISLYQDGMALRPPFKGTWKAASYQSSPSNRITIGSEEDESKSFFSGLIDELRVATVARSVEWLAAEARGPKMATVGAEEKLAP
jgi:hypothetical protein